MILLVNVYIKLEEEKICVKRYTKIVRVGGMPWPKTGKRRLCNQRVGCLWNVRL